MEAKMRFLVGLLTLLCALTVKAEGFDQLGTLVQQEFRLLSEDLGAALSYKPLIPAEPLGITGFDIGIEASATDLQSAQVLEDAIGEAVPGILPIARLHAHKGLPFGIDVGVSYSSIPDLDVELWGGELRYAILKGGVAVPALALRGSFTKVQGVDQLDFETRAVDLSISKGFTLLTPYAGVGRVWVTSTPKVTPGPVEEEFGLTKYFAGLNVALGIISVAAEADRTGDAWTYSGKFALRF
jgi:hypothetical protein